MIEINIHDELYPNNLRQLKNPPQKLYVEGNEKILNQIAICVIGSRSHSDYGKRMCERFTKELVENGINIVSGMAKGIDTIAHEACIKNRGKTIAVLPSGFNQIYPQENEVLYYKILEREGAVISEYPPDTKYDKKKPLERNRIVSGLSVGTLVIEAGYNSGSSITAKCAKEQGKKIFCVPSSLENRKGITSNELIKKGAKLITCIEDILEEFPEIEKNNKSTNIVNEERLVEKEYIDIYNILSNEPIHINEICKKSNLSISEVNYKLMMLEIDGNILQLPGKQFIRK